MTSAAAAPNIGLSDENTIPALGIGVGGLSDTEAEKAVATALEIGVRLIDTAAAYGNEEGVGRAIAASGVPRAEMFLTTKLDIPNLGFQASQDAAKASLQRLGQDYVDLYLIHWPGADSGKYVDSWGGLLKVQGDGLAKSTGWIRRTLLKRRIVKMLAGVSYEKIDDAGLHLRLGDESQVLDVDTIVMCAGQEPRRELLDDLKKAGVAVSLIGGADVAAELDAKRAIDQGTRAAAAI